MSPSHLPEHLAVALHERWPDQGKRWARVVDLELAGLCDRYKVSSCSVMPSRYSLVVDAVTDCGRRLVFRGSPDPAGAYQQLAVSSLASVGVGPVVYECISTETGTWTILDRIVPGTPVGDLDQNSIDWGAIGRALRSMAGQPPPSPDMPSLIDWLRSRLRDTALNDLAPGCGPPTASERQLGLAALDELEDGYNAGLCHGDASPWNLLIDSAGGVVLIDPRGVAGELAYDVAVVVLKAGPLLPPDVGVPYLSALVGVDSGRVNAWMATAAAARI